MAYRGDLIASQTAYPPARIVRIRLSADGASVTRLDVLERANPQWGEVTLMTLDGDDIVYVADAQWRKFEANGKPAPGLPPTATPRRLNRRRT